MRRNNKQEMTITEQLAYVKECICADYCRYVDLKHHGKVSEAELKECCEYCPLNEL